MTKIQEMADLIEAARKLGPMTDEQRREQSASFAFGNLALTSAWCDKSATELAELMEVCRRFAGCDAGAPVALGANMHEETLTKGPAR